MRDAILRGDAVSHCGKGGRSLLTREAEGISPLRTCWLSQRSGAVSWTCGSCQSEETLERLSLFHPPALLLLLEFLPAESLGRSLQRTARTRRVSATSHAPSMGSYSQGAERNFSAADIPTASPNPLPAVGDRTACEAGNCHKSTSREKVMPETTELQDCRKPLPSAAEAALKWVMFSCQLGEQTPPVPSQGWGVIIQTTTQKDPVFNENMNVNSWLCMKGALGMQLKRWSESGANQESKTSPIPTLVSASKGKFLQSPQGRSLNRSY